jgi:hypothetical protein
LLLLTAQDVTMTLVQQLLVEAVTVCVTDTLPVLRESLKQHVDAIEQLI